MSYNMRSNEDFKTEVLERTRKYKTEQKRKVKRALFTALPCVVVIVAAALAAPGIMNGMLMKSEDAAPMENYRGENDYMYSISGSTSNGKNEAAEEDAIIVDEENDPAHGADEIKTVKITVTQYENGAIIKERIYTDEKEISDYLKNNLSHTQSAEFEEGFTVPPLTGDAPVENELKVTLYFEHNYKTEYFITTDGALVINGFSYQKLKDPEKLIEELTK